MIERIVAWALRRDRLVIAGFAVLAAFGVYAWQHLAVEAYPDIADTSAQVITQYPGHAAEEVEQQITIPLERELNGVPGLYVMRSKSTFGLSLITLVFRDGTEDYFARQRIEERIGNVQLPDGASTGLDPLTSATGEIFRYTLESQTRSQRELRELQEWVVMPKLKQVAGVVDVSNFGGEITEFQLLVDPAKLDQYGLTLKQITGAIPANNANAGGSLMVRGEQGIVVRGVGLVQSLSDLGNIVVTENNGVPIFLRDVGQVQLGALQRSGICGKDDQHDVVSGIVLLLRGENPSIVLAGVHAKVEELNTKILPADVRVVPYLDRTNLVNTTVHTVSGTLLEGMFLVVLVLVLFLGSVRGALLVAITIPLALLVAFILMWVTNIPANLLSLGAIDFGIIVDAAIVLMESILRKHEEHADRPLTLHDAREAALQVAKPIFFATLIIIVAYIPLFALQRVERKLFTPMAFTVGYALGGALLTALLLIPALAYRAYRKPRKVFRNPVLIKSAAWYSQLLGWVLAKPRRALIPGAVAGVLAIVLALFLGREFLPYLDEGSMWMQVQLPPGISFQKADELSSQFRNAVRAFPQVSVVITQLGRTDDGMDPWTMSHIESYIGLKPYDEWGGDKQALIRAMSDSLARQLPGVEIGFSQPIIDMVNDKIAGAHSELVVKIYGKEFDEMRRIAEAVAQELSGMQGAADVAVDQEPPLPQLQIHINREAAARFGINVEDISDLIETAIGGRAVSQVFMGERRYNIAVRYVERVRNSADAIGKLMLTNAAGVKIPLAQVADIVMGSGESTITREMNRHHLTVKLDLRGRDLASFLAEAQQRIEHNVRFDHSAYEILWGGQFENEARAQSRLFVITPIVLAAIFLLLYAAFGTVRHAMIVLTCIPLALLGGVVALHLRGITLNMSSAVGFIALSGVAVQNGVIMVANLNRWRGMTASLKEAVLRGASERLRPVLMTATVGTFGLIPAALAHGIGSDVQRPLATVIVGGLTTATFLTLVVLPALYYVIERRQKKNTMPIAEVIE